jgi:hypothetical protein
MTKKELNGNQTWATHTLVIPAQAGIQRQPQNQISAQAGMTRCGLLPQKPLSYTQVRA